MAISFIYILFERIVGGYLGKFVINHISNSMFNILYIFIYFIISFITSEWTFNVKIKNKFNNRALLQYFSPTIVIQALSLIFFFSKLKITNKYLIKLILFFNPLNFNVTLIHAICASIDYFRYLIFKILKIKNICILIEKKIF